MSSIARTAATGGDLDPEFLAWSTSLPVDRRLLEVDCRGSVAHVKGLRAAGLLEPDEADRLVAALQSLPERVQRGEVVLPEDEEDVHMAIEAWLRSEVGELAGKLHTGRSRNDQVAVDLKLWCIEAVKDVEAGIDAVLEAASTWAKIHGEVAMPSYTHRKVAIPALGRVWIDGALCEGLRRDRVLLQAVRAELADSPLGAGAVGGTTLPIDSQQVARDLGFSSGPRNPIDAVGSRDHAQLLLFVCARIGQHLARFSTDVIELCSDELVALSGAIAGGSSMMPHKKNPDLFELVRGQAALRQGELVALVSTFAGLGSGYHRDLQQDKEVVFSAVDGVRSSLRMIALAIGHVSPRPEPCRRALEQGDAVATDLCEGLVEHGLPFRAAYALVGKLVAQQRSAGKVLVDLTPEDLEEHGIPEKLAERLDVEAVARRRAARF